MISSIANLVYKLPHEFPNDVRLRILGSKEILGKYEIWVETAIGKSSFQKSNFDISSKKNKEKEKSKFCSLSQSKEKYLK